MKKILALGSLVCLFVTGCGCNGLKIGEMRLEEKQENLSVVSYDEFSNAYDTLKNNKLVHSPEKIRVVDINYEYRYNDETIEEYSKYLDSSNGEYEYKVDGKVLVSGDFKKGKFETLDDSYKYTYYAKEYVTETLMPSLSTSVLTMINDSHVSDMLEFVSNKDYSKYGVEYKLGNDIGFSFSVKSNEQFTHIDTYDYYLVYNLDILVIDGYLLKCKVHYKDVDTNKTYKLDISNDIILKKK